MTLEKLRITKNDGQADERQYDIYPIQNVEIRSRKEAFSIAPPGLSASENILLGVSGMQATITIRATVWDNGEDRSNGTAASSIVSVEDQIQYLEDEIHGPGFSVDWKLDHLTGGAFSNDPVFIENIEPTVLSQQSSKWKEVRFQIRRGESV